MGCLETNRECNVNSCNIINPTLPTRLDSLNYVRQNVCLKFLYDAIDTNAHLCVSSMRNTDWLLPFIILLHPCGLIIDPVSFALPSFSSCATPEPKKLFWGLLELILMRNTGPNHVIQRMHHARDDRGRTARCWTDVCHCIPCMMLWYSSRTRHWQGIHHIVPLICLQYTHVHPIGSWVGIGSSLLSACPPFSPTIQSSVSSLMAKSIPQKNWTLTTHESSNDEDGKHPHP